MFVSNDTNDHLINVDQVKHFHRVKDTDGTWKMFAVLVNGDKYLITSSKDEDTFKYNWNLYKGKLNTIS